MDTDDSASLSFLFVLRRDDRLKAVSFRNAIPEVAAFSFCNRVDTKRKSEEYSWVAPLILMSCTTRKLRNRKIPAGNFNIDLMGNFFDTSQ